MGRQAASTGGAPRPRRPRAGTIGPAPAADCALCGRPLGLRVEKHHLTPRRYGGRETVALHPICHRKIHSVLSERALAARFDSIAALARHPEIARFVTWLAGKPPNFHKPTFANRRRAR